MSVTDSFGSTHKPTLMWGVSISTVLIVVAVVLLVLWITRNKERM